MAKTLCHAINLGVDKPYHTIVVVLFCDGTTGGVAKHVISWRVALLTSWCGSTVCVAKKVIFENNLDLELLMEINLKVK